MHWYWAPHVHAVMHGDDLVVLDTVRNDYLVLAQAKDQIRLEPSGASAFVLDEDLARDLADGGLGAREPFEQQLIRANAPAARTDLFDEPDPELAVTATAALALLSTTVSARLSWTSLARLIVPPPKGDGDEHEIRLMALALRAALPWLPFQGDCVYRAALLRAYLSDFAGRTRWVFGVSTWPFAAHCWVQLDDVVLNDRLQRVRRYTPILAV